jgi:hypothetical protein
MVKKIQKKSPKSEESFETNSKPEESFLTLGWRVTMGLDPRYWLSGKPKPGLQPLDELVRIPAHAIGSHTAIIAQSGSGKSFFLGRLIEEIILQTKAQCLVLDPNADFRRVQRVESASLWENAKYDAVERRGKLPHEASQEEFESRWSKVSIRIRTGIGARDTDERLQLWWPSLSMTFLAEDLDPMLRTDLYHCHNFIKQYGFVFELKYSDSKKPRDFLKDARKLFARLRNPDKEERKRILELEFNPNQIIKEVTTRSDASVQDEYVALNQGVKIRRSDIELRIGRFIESGLTVTDDVNPIVERFYFGKAREYQSAGIIRTDLTGKSWDRSLLHRVDVVDLPSLPDASTRLLAIDAILTTKWNEARRAWSSALEKKAEDDSRIPTFIVIDEAHNLIPNETKSKPAIALREQFRTIVAEGRKYGLFLLLVSQRPDKLDPLVLSECENKAIMRLGSASVLNITRKMLGLEDLPPKLLEKCLEFETGRVLLVGPWSSPSPQIMYSAARRTIEGGRNLRAKHWASPQSELS